MVAFVQGAHTGTHACLRCVHTAATNGTQSLTIEEGCRLARENAKDIIACGAHARVCATGFVPRS
jgi:hypothetical protein